MAITPSERTVSTLQGGDPATKKRGFWKSLAYIVFGIGESNTPQQPMTFSQWILSWVKTLGGALVIVMFLNGAVVASFVVPTGSMEKTVLIGDFVFVNKFVYGPSTPQIIPFLDKPIPFFKFPGLREPKQGDVIVFIYPGDRDDTQPKDFQYYLKRCIAVGGDELHIVGGKVFVNGKEFALPPEAKPYPQIAEVSHPDMIPYDKAETFPPNKGWTRNNYGPLRIPKKGDVVNISINNLHEWDVFIRREGHLVGAEGATVLIDGKPATTYTVQRDYVFGMGDNRDESLDSRFWGFIPKENVVGTPMVVYWSWDTHNPSMIEKFKTLRSERFFKSIQ
jgi:signal peptidase I